MSVQVICDYTLTVVGNQKQALLASQMAAVPLDLNLPRFWGLIPTSDVTTTPALNKILREITLNQGLGTAAITAVMPPGGGGAIQSLVLGATAGYFAAPPILQFSVQPNVTLVASAVPIMGVAEILVANPGSGYSIGVTASLVGGNLAPGGVPAVLGAVTTIGPGEIDTVAVISPGSGYTTYPSVVFTDVSGSGAEAYGGLQVVGLTLVNPGRGYGNNPAPTVFAAPVYPLNVSLNTPEGPNNDHTLANWMSCIMQNRLRSPVAASIPAYA